eukprot:2092097-Alexandrium_andersonii.AAC.1
MRGAPATAAVYQQRSQAAVQVDAMERGEWAWPPVTQPWGQRNGWSSTPGRSAPDVRGRAVARAGPRGSH